MKRFVFLVFSAALFISGVSAFADQPNQFYGKPDVSNNQNLSSAYVPVSSNVQDWVGMTALQLVQKMGTPDFTSVSDNGDKLYNYDQPIGQKGVRGNRAAPTQLEFDVDTNGKILSAKSTQL